MKIIVDPGHGGVWRPNPPKGDPGVVTPDGKKIESHYNFIYALTLKDVLQAAGYTVELTRDHDEYTVDNRLRTKNTQPGDLFISLHFDSYIGGRKLIYFSGLDKTGKSKEFADVVESKLNTGVVIPSTTSRFGRLYIDDAKCPAILIEVDRIDRADDSYEARKAFADKVLSAVNEYIKPPLPFSRVLILRGDRQRELNIEKMSIVGDKLYVRVKE